MENTKNPIRRVFLPYVNYDTVGAYYDTVAKVNKISFKKYGITIPYATSFAGYKAQTNFGAVTSQEIQLNNACVCDSCNWEYGITLVKKVKEPGVNNNETNYNEKTYSGRISKINCTTGLIDDVYLLAAENDIITQVTDDLGLSNDNPDPITGTGSVAYAVRSYSLNATAFATNILAFTINGVTTNIVLNSGATIITMCADLNVNATFNVHAVAYAIDATTLGIYGLTGTDLFTVADGSGATTLTVNYRRIWFKAKSPDVQFAILYSSNNNGRNGSVTFATTYKKSFYVIDGTAAAATANSGITFVVDGTAHNAASNATVAGMAGVINGFAVTGLYATVNGAYIYVNGTDAITTLNLIYSVSPGNYATYTASTLYIPAVGVYPCMAKGQFPFLTGGDIFMLFANQNDQGALAAYDTSAKPDTTISYTCYYFQVDNASPAIHGASHWDSVKQQVEVYVPTTLVATNAFSDSGAGGVLSTKGTLFNVDPGTAKNTTFEGLLWVFSGGLASGAGVITAGVNPNAWTN